MLEYLLAILLLFEAGALEQKKTVRPCTEKFNHHEETALHACPTLATATSQLPPERARAGQAASSLPEAPYFQSRTAN